MNSSSGANLHKFNMYSKAPVILNDDELKNKKSILKTSKGEIQIKLFGDEAPLTVSNHIFLVKEKFYDDLIFHRREEGFVIQGGDPLGQGFGGPGYSFEDEPVSREYKRGIVAMANSGPDTNGSQFFIMLADVALPPLYTIFGEVISGIEVVDQIQIGDKILEAKIVNNE
jgi:cyclophilin family peptidyl-prolyl cis-trans isomerase